MEARSAALLALVGRAMGKQVQETAPDIAWDDAEDEGE